jgi:SAM-dependent methyltransferase
VNSSPPSSESDSSAELIALFQSLLGSSALVWICPDENLATLLRQLGHGVESIPASALDPKQTSDVAPTRWASGTCPAVWVGPAVSSFGIGPLDAVVAEAVRISSHLIGLVVPLDFGRTEKDWDDRVLALNVRLHPMRQLPTVRRLRCVMAPEGFALLLYEKIPAAAAAVDPFSMGHTPQPRFPDLLRKTGRGADAAVQRYVLAREWALPGSDVLDVGCGRGFGAAVLRGDLSVRVTGVDRDREAVDYARRHYSPAGSGTRFLLAELDRLDRLDFAAPASFDLVTSFDTLESLMDPEGFLSAVHRVLKPGGRLILSVANRWLDEKGNNPVPQHLHVYDLALVSRELKRFFRIEQVYRQNAGGTWKRPQEHRLERFHGHESEA